MSDKDKVVQFITPIDSSFDTTLEAELARWGYFEQDADADCMFDTYLDDAFKTMGIDPLGDVEGGPNRSHKIQHWDPHARDEEGFQLPVAKQTNELDGKEYKISPTRFYLGCQLIATPSYTGQSRSWCECRRRRDISP